MYKFIYKSLIEILREHDLIKIFKDAIYNLKSLIHKKLGTKFSIRGKIGLKPVRKF